VTGVCEVSYGIYEYKVCFAENNSMNIVLSYMSWGMALNCIRQANNESSEVFDIIKPG